MLVLEPAAVEKLRCVARRGDVVAAMADFYHRTSQRIAALPATCWNRGECCRFGAYGHRLYVTALEVAYYLALRAEQPALVEDACPHAREGRCHAREVRPLGCRIFFCDPQARAWQGPLTEELLAELRDLHRRLAVDYFYADWMVVLRALAGEPAKLTISQTLSLPRESPEVLAAPRKFSLFVRQDP